MYYFKFLNNVSSEENLNNVRHPLLIKRLRFEGKIIKTIIYNKIYIYMLDFDGMFQHSFNVYYNLS